MSTYDPTDIDRQLRDDAERNARKQLDRDAELLDQAQDDAASREHFVGLIDGAQAEAFLGGARLERFMTALAVLAGLPA